MKLGVQHVMVSLIDDSLGNQCGSKGVEPGRSHVAFIRDVAGVDRLANEVTLLGLFKVWMRHRCSFYAAKTRGWSCRKDLSTIVEQI